MPATSEILLVPTPHALSSIGKNRLRQRVRGQPAETSIAVKRLARRLRRGQRVDDRSSVAGVSGRQRLRFDDRAVRCGGTEFVPRATQCGVHAKARPAARRSRVHAHFGIEARGDTVGGVPPGSGRVRAGSRYLMICRCDGRGLPPPGSFASFASCRSFSSAASMSGMAGVVAAASAAAGFGATVNAKP